MASMHEHVHALSPAAALRAEHDAIESLLVAMDGMAAALEAGARVPERDLRAAIGVARGFADACHHAKEERVVFPAIRGTAAGASLGLSLSSEHQAMRALVGGIERAASAASADDPQARVTLAREERAYAKTLRAHIEREERELLPALDRLPPATRDRVAREMEIVEEEETGAGEHERFESEIERLREKWGAIRAP